MTDIGFFQTGRQHHIQQDAGDQIRKIRCGQSNKTKRRSENCKRNHSQDRNTGHGKQRHWGRCAALDKGQLRSTDHVNDQCLAPHGFHEPSSLEHPDILRLHSRKLRSAVMSGQIVEQNTTGHEHGAEYKIHENVGCKVEDGAGRSDPNHKTAYTGSIPFPGLCDKFLVHVIPGNRGTGQVVDQVQKNQMHAHHRQEGQQSGGRQHREHIAEVGRCGHLDILDHVGIGLTAFSNTLGIISLIMGNSIFSSPKATANQEKSNLIAC